MSSCKCQEGIICICEEKNTLWKEICEDFAKDRELVKIYLGQLEQHTEAPTHFSFEILKNIFPILKLALISTLKEAENQECIKVQKTDFDPIDHIAEYLWNSNTKYSERQKEFTRIHDMQWVNEYLKENPRPNYPFHVIWSQSYAALKIQAFLRGYWVRRLESVQEIRKFWKQLKIEAKSSSSSISRRFDMN